MYHQTFHLNERFGDVPETNVTPFGAAAEVNVTPFGDATEVNVTLLGGMRY